MADGTFGSRLRAEREAQGVTLASVARSCDVSVSYLSDVELGRRNPPRRHLAAIASALDLPQETVRAWAGEPREVEVRGWNNCPWARPGAGDWCANALRFGCGPGDPPPDWCPLRGRPVLVRLATRRATP